MLSLHFFFFFSFKGLWSVCSRDGFDRKFKPWILIMLLSPAVANISDRAKRVSGNWVFWHISTWNDHLLFLCLETVLLLTKKLIDSSQNIIEASCARHRNQCLVDCNLMEIYRNLFRRYHLIRGYLLIPLCLTNNFLECLATLACTRLASHFLLLCHVRFNECGCHSASLPAGIAYFSRSLQKSSAWKKRRNKIKLG